MFRLAEPYIVWTDGACHNNGRHDAEGAYGVYSESVLISKRLCDVCMRPHTNNKAELVAIQAALHSLPPRITAVIVRTDSELCVNIINRWHFDWVKKGGVNAQGKVPANWTLICDLMERIHQLRNDGMSVEVEHVRGHADDFGNQQAHMLAQRALKA
ncbi:ribonuclease H-like protein [Jaminaea rosea]|uniref:ribonuclease H n=1 Tax=Jaminaea rosea TaxID=1569628 RepID=A0A316UKV4_9BASI|nr:ribonuclease H-like protein [Jaminaea rosea]PWN25887.1 ribonuclease H-like protein [Jaminaea rosea]